MSSNLEKALQKGLDYAQNMRQTWVVAHYFEELQLLYLVFPEGNDV
ncbi:MAG: hypothetical protein JNK00_00045 [Flavipsychrobacter sp.]|nr:hypothetical protein [Flavipsychrobacter sp.]